jgi:hypothetical protein
MYTMPASTSVKMQVVVEEWSSRDRGIPNPIPNSRGYKPLVLISKVGYGKNNLYGHNKGCSFQGERQ